MKPVLFIDRDGTLIEEPDDFQVDSFEKLRLIPEVIGSLSRIVRDGQFELVMVSNQDGLGTKAFPEEGFLSVHNFLIQLFEREGIAFSDILIDRSFESDGLPTRKPGVAMLTKYLDGSYDLAGSFVIGDRSTDIRLAANLGAHHTIEDVAITLGETFNDALGDKRGIERYGFTLPMDDCLAQVALDFGGRNWIVWDAEFKREMIGGMPTEMFVHFFKSFTDHARCNLNIKAEGVNEHHKIEAIFKAFSRAIKIAIAREAESNVVPSSKGVL